MSSEKPVAPAVGAEGWFTTGDEPRLIGTKCRECDTFFFPKETVACRNPACRSTTLDETPLSRKGTLWSYTTAFYQPPKPSMPVAPDAEFEPYTIAVVTLDEEKMSVMGQVPADVSAESLKVGMPMELVVDRLFEDEETVYLIWKWRPSAEGAQA